MEYTYEIEKDGQRYEIPMSEPDWMKKMDLYSRMPEQIKHIEDHIDDFDVTMDVLNYIREVTFAVSTIDVEFYNSLSPDEAFRMFGSAMHVMLGKEPPETNGTDEYRVENESLFDTDDDGFIDLEEWR